MEEEAVPLVTCSLPHHLLSIRYVSPLLPSLGDILGRHFFRSARASCTTSSEPVRTPDRAKNLDTYMQAYMPHESSGDSSNQPIGHMGSPRRLPEPPGAPRPPPPPPPPWDPKRDLLASLNSKNHLNCLTYHLRTHQIPLLILWDILSLLLETLRP